MWSAFHGCNHAYNIVQFKYSVYTTRMGLEQIMMGYR